MGAFSSALGTVSRDFIFAKRETARYPKYDLSISFFILLLENVQRTAAALRSDSDPIVQSRTDWRHSPLFSRVRLRLF